MHTTLDERHLTGIRREMLQLLAERGPLDAGSLIHEWSKQHHQPRSRQSAALVVGQILWRLLNLGWVTRDDSTYAITDAGRHMLRAQTDSAATES